MQAALEQRLLAARLLAERMILTGGVDIEPEIAALASALTEEDEVRGEFYRRALASGLSLEQQFALLQDRRAWAAVKLRIASAVWPFAGSAMGGIRCADRAGTRRRYGQSQPGGRSADQRPARCGCSGCVRAEALLWLAQQMDLGLYPGASPAELDGQLRNAQAELTRLGSPRRCPSPTNLTPFRPVFASNPTANDGAQIGPKA